MALTAVNLAYYQDLMAGAPRRDPESTACRLHCGSQVRLGKLAKEKAPKNQAENKKSKVRNSPRPCSFSPDPCMASRTLFASVAYSAARSTDLAPRPPTDSAAASPIIQGGGLLFHKRAILSRLSRACHHLGQGCHAFFFCLPFFLINDRLADSKRTCGKRRCGACRFRRAACWRKKACRMRAEIGAASPEEPE